MSLIAAVVNGVREWRARTERELITALVDPPDLGHSLVLSGNMSITGDGDFHIGAVSGSVEAYNAHLVSGTYNRIGVIGVPVWTVGNEEDVVIKSEPPDIVNIMEI